MVVVAVSQEDVVVTSPVQPGHDGDTDVTPN